ncbi:hypothetical protein Pint_13832 [Pistacia integerrima]|uniref:Uncharacterized protein n=1 Tax=Pistacia integerrima TaxID=434235 RepID=A0ACC0YBB7_9ROSI|nr:hypothetical protein Pint_13832 [Pistacia integerrima]
MKYQDPDSILHHRNGLRRRSDSVIKILDTLYRERDYARFFVLETIARVPYFAFISVPHLYESFGWWRKADYLKVHFAESWNEMHRLLIMEAACGFLQNPHSVCRIQFSIHDNMLGGQSRGHSSISGGKQGTLKGDDVRQAYRGVDGEDFVKE